MTLCLSCLYLCVKFQIFLCSIFMCNIKTVFVRYKISRLYIAHIIMHIVACTCISIDVYQCFNYFGNLNDNIKDVDYSIQILYAAVIHLYVVDIKSINHPLEIKYFIAFYLLKGSKTALIVPEDSVTLHQIV